jgi:hypothetical protein
MPDTWKNNGPEIPSRRIIADAFVPPTPLVLDDWQLVSSLTINTGAIESGGIADLEDLDDVDLVLTEQTGSPGFSYDFNFGGVSPVPSFSLYLNLHGHYSGNLAHTIKLQQYNYVTLSFVNVTADPTDILDGVEATYQFTLIAQALYISNGAARIRFIHMSSGNQNHRFHIDQMYLSLV